MFGIRSGADRKPIDQSPSPGTTAQPSRAPESGSGATVQPTGTIAATAINPYANPGVPELEVEDSTVDFHAAFGTVATVRTGKRIPDPLARLDPKERADYHHELQDVIDAQRYGRSLGSGRRRP